MVAKEIYGSFLSCPVSIGSKGREKRNTCFLLACLLTNEIIEILSSNSTHSIGRVRSGSARYVIDILLPFSIPFEKMVKSTSRRKQREEQTTIVIAPKISSIKDNSRVFIRDKGWGVNTVVNHFYRKEENPQSCLVATKKISINIDPRVSFVTTVYMLHDYCQVLILQEENS